MRVVQSCYRDPLDLIWLRAAQACGLSIARSDAAFASYDGQGVLRLGTAASLDADDCLAQMILHELCHGWVEGPEAWS
ncbi:MAG: YkgJ family cysteine cluster protein, partial [Polyangiales bacterium]